ncbi:MAG: KH domain-containing protein [Clostridia bacterium]|nr:KH domain-containing protein [Clostridia bacterium]
MQEMLAYIVKSLVSSPDAVEIAEEQQGKTKVYRVFVDKKDLGSVIGHRGCIANAIRTVIKSINSNHERVVVKFDAKEVA